MPKFGEVLEIDNAVCSESQTNICSFASYVDGKEMDKYQELISEGKCFLVENIRVSYIQHIHYNVDATMIQGTILNGEHRDKILNIYY